MTRTGAALALLLAGCSGSINVTELDLDEKPGKVVNGVPFRVKERYQVEVYEKGKKGYALIHSETRTLANPDKLYVLHYFGGPLANSTTKFVMQPDGSINDVSMSVTSQGEEALTEVGKQVEAVATKVDANRTAREAERRTDEDATVAALEALNDVHQKQLELSALPPDAAPADRARIEDELELLKLKANIGARRAGQPRPFPEVGS